MDNVYKMRRMTLEEIHFNGAPCDSQPLIVKYRTNENHIHRGIIKS